jgi:DNA-binding CsgD family transcriptional regulator
VRPVEEFDLTVALDYGLFHLSGLPMHDGGTDPLARLVEEAATLQRVTIPVPSGRYAARMTGRGFLNHGWPGSTTPGDEWRLQLWPAAGPIPPPRVRSWMSRDETLAMVSSLLDRLNQREREVAVAVGQGRSNAEIGGVLYLGVPTVKTNVSGILTKLDRNDRVQIAPLVHGPRSRAARRAAVTGRPGRFRRDRRRGGGGRRARRRAA